MVRVRIRSERLRPRLQSLHAPRPAPRVCRPRSAGRTLNSGRLPLPRLTAARATLRGAAPPHADTMHHPLKAVVGRAIVGTGAQIPAAEAKSEASMRSRAQAHCRMRGAGLSARIRRLSSPRPPCSARRASRLRQARSAARMPGRSRLPQIPRRAADAAPSRVVWARANPPSTRQPRRSTTPSRRRVRQAVQSHRRARQTRAAVAETFATRSSRSVARSVLRA